MSMGINVEKPKMSAEDVGALAKWVDLDDNRRLESPSEITPESQQVIAAGNMGGVATPTDLAAVYLDACKGVYGPKALMAAKALEQERKVSLKTIAEDADLKEPRQTVRKVIFWSSLGAALAAGIAALALVSYILMPIAIVLGGLAILVRAGLTERTGSEEAEVAIQVKANYDAQRQRIRAAIDDLCLAVGNFRAAAATSRVLPPEPGSSGRPK